MRPRVRLRSVTPEEETEIRKLANAQNAPAKLVKRAGILVRMLDNPELFATDAGVRAGFSTAIGTVWVSRFNEAGIAGLQDKPRSGCPRKHDEKVRSRLINLALQKPPTLDYPFAMWTLGRLQQAFEEKEGVHLSDSTIWEWMEAEGFEWKRQESWFQDVEKHDPEFVEKRGLSSIATSNLRPIHG